MKVIDINNTSIYGFESGNVSYEVGIQLTKKTYLSISYNNTSTIYDEQPNDSKSPFSPYCHCIWSIGKFGKYGMGIGEDKYEENEDMSRL